MFIKNQLKLITLSHIVPCNNAVKTIITKKAKHLVFNKTHHVHKKAKTRLMFNNFSSTLFNLPYIRTLSQARVMLTWCLLFIFKIRKDFVCIFKLQIFLLFVWLGPYSSMART